MKSTNLLIALLLLSIISCGDNTKETDTQKSENVKIVETEIEEIEERETMQY